MTTLAFLIFVCAISFLIYGASCLFSPHMQVEFQRYGLAKYRQLTGVLQLLAAIGLLVGLAVPWIGGIAATGLALQMACGVGVRVTIGDPWYMCLPAATYMLLCSWLAVQLL